MSNHRTTLAAADEQELVRQLAQRVVEVTAPEEMVLFDETAEEYFANPEGVLNAHGKDEPVGFGLELALLTPYILAVVTPVIQLLATMVADALKAEGQPSVTGFIRRLLHRPMPSSASPQGDPSPSLSTDQLSLVRKVALERGMGVGLPDQQAALLADAIVGGVAVAGTA
jgi:hypothetical protein